MFGHAHPPQLLEELHAKERDMSSLQAYADLLLQRISANAPDLLDSVESTPNTSAAACSSSASAVHVPAQDRGTADKLTFPSL